MPLEATMMIIDNSEYMRNGDYQPTRFEAQSDAVTTVFQTKIDSNPENTVGIMSMAGKGPEVLVTHTKEVGHILQAIHTTSSKVGGSIDIPTAIAIAQLALKHRENKNLRQRIIVFTGSPLEGAGADLQGMVKLAKKLKKNNVAIDVVAFGDGIEEVTPTAGSSSTEEEDSVPSNGVLKSLVDAASSGDNSHYISVAPGHYLLSDAILNSPILAGDRGIPEEAMGDAGAAGGSGGGGAAGFDFGVDPSLDPELAMALRMSMQEAEAREAAEAAASGQAATAGTAALIPAEPTDDEEDAMLQQALKMSAEGGEDIDMDAEGDDDEEEDEEDEEDEDEDMDEDAAIAKAIEMSMKEQQDDPEKKKKK